MTELRGPVRIVGTGLIGTSIGLALARLGVVVELVDADPDNALMAERIGAGSRLVTSSVTRPPSKRVRAVRGGRGVSGGTAS